MKNRFNLNEEEKKHIRGLHNINEQEAPTDSLGNPIEPNPLLKKSEEEEILEKLLGEAQRLTRFVENRSQGKDNWSNEDLVNIQENINTEINNLLKK
jgi:hypothetical protein